ASRAAGGGQILILFSTGFVVNIDTDTDSQIAERPTLARWPLFFLLRRLRRPLRAGVLVAFVLAALITAIEVCKGPALASAFQIRQNALPPSVLGRCGIMEEEAVQVVPVPRPIKHAAAVTVGRGRKMLLILQPNPELHATVLAERAGNHHAFNV